VAGLVVAAGGYGILWSVEGTHRLGPFVAWTAGLVAILVATSSAIDPLSDARLSVHMVQHEILAFVAAPLLVVGMRPVTTVLLPRLGSPVARWGHTLTRPRTAWILAAATLWAWHWPSAYDFALAHPAVHDVEHATLLAAYALYWSPFTSFGHAVPRLRSDAARILYLMTGGTQSGILGAVLAFHNTPFYTHYVALAGGGALGDQDAAGMIMLLSGAAAFVVAAAVTMRGT
jgi:putative membrane protein